MGQEDHSMPENKRTIGYLCPVCGKDRGWAEGDIQTRRLGKEG